MSAAVPLHRRDAAPARRAPAPFARVLCLADPSDDGAVAVAHAGMLARATGAGLTVFPASEIGNLGYHPRDARLARDVRSAAGRTMTIVVMTPHDRGRLATVLATSVTIARPPDRVPVLCARGEARPYRRILVPTDFTPRSRAALRLAARLGAFFGSEVTVLHAIGSGQDDEGARAALARFVPRELSWLAPRLAVERGAPGAAIVRAAERMAADLVVVSTGAERVIRQAPCSVLVS